MIPTFDSVAQWQQNVDQMRLFAMERPAASTAHLLDHFGLSGMSQVSLNLQVPNSAVLQINGKQLPDGFQGNYFNDIPIGVTRDTHVGAYLFALGSPRHCGLVGEPLCPRGPSGNTRTRASISAPQWQQTGYDDTTWAAGPAQLGYGDGDEATVVGYGGNASNKYITTYFRKSFELTDVARFRSLSFSLLADDGGVAYLNGQEIARLNMPSRHVNYTVPPSKAIANETALRSLPSLLLF